MSVRISILLFLLIPLVFTTYAQDANVVAMEYYLDTDPGVGLGTPITFAAGSSVLTSFSVPAASLTPGFHRIVVRARDEHNFWSTQHQRSFFVQDMAVLEPESPITAMEYFFDTDPGVGNGTAIPFSTGAVVDVDAAISTAALAPGFHKIYIRARDEDGNWSMTSRAVFYLHASQNIVAVEYFLNTDPGVGNATPLTITAAPGIEHTTTLPTSGLPEGTHTVGVRASREDDFWSETFVAEFSICTSPVPGFTTDVVCVGNTTSFTDHSTNVSDATYSWDFDGDGIADDNTAGGTTFSYPVAGTYTATLTIDRYGCIEMFSASVTVADEPAAYAGADDIICAAATTLAADPAGAGETGMWTIVEGSATITDPADPATSVTHIAPGNVTLQWTVTHTLSGCSATDEVVITYHPAPEPDFDTDVVCVGSATSFTDQSVNNTGGSYSWDFDNDGAVDHTDPGNTSFVYATSGTWTATLTIQAGECTETVSKAVEVVDLPTADAGPDQSLCTTETTLAGSALSAGETGTWTVVTGNAVIVDPNDPATALTDITTGTVVLSWTVARDPGGCSSVDEVTIQSNLPIIAGLVTASVALGESVTREVQSYATTNAGDVLETTIVSEPTKGTATVNADGSITYIPAEGTVGPDVVVYQICNQCDRCATNNLEIDILNNPPVIDPPAVTVTPGANVSIDLLAIISDPNNNVDPSSLSIIQQPTSGAVASIDATYRLIVDYTGVFYSGIDQLTIEVCDLSGACSSNVILIAVDIPANPPVTVYNAVSPVNNDGRHDYLELENIEAYPDNRVYIVNRWGVRVYEAAGYNNASVRFEGEGLPSGTYYYSIDLGNGDERLNGFFVLKK